MQIFKNSLSTQYFVPVKYLLEFVFIIAIHDHKCSNKGNIDVVHQHYCQTFEITSPLSVKSHRDNAIRQCQLNTINTSHI